MNKFVAAFGVALVGVTLAAQAETVVVDADANGVFSIEELTAAYADLTAELFAEIDLNADGSIDAEELAAAKEAGKLAM